MSGNEAPQMNPGNEPAISGEWHDPKQSGEQTSSW
jgi:hypothetical protein